MGERNKDSIRDKNLIPYSTFQPIPTHTFESPTFSLKQQEIFDELILSYMKGMQRKGFTIPFLESTLEKATRVLAGDSLQRGLHISGKESLDPKDNIRTIINLGNREREGLYNKGRDIRRRYARPLSTALSTRVGALAIPKSYLEGLKKEGDEYPLTESLEYTEQCVSLNDTRTRLLPEVARFVLSLFPPQQFPDMYDEKISDEEKHSLSSEDRAQYVVTDRFSFDDQAKLVRNMIFSVVTRQNPFPILSSEEVFDILRQNNLPTRFIPEIVSALAEFVSTRKNIPYELHKDTSLYILDLAKQVEENCMIVQGMEKNTVLYTEEEKRDFYSRRIGEETLLLLNPLLEEQAPIVRLENVHDIDNDYSLWHPSLSVTFGNVRVPKMEILTKMTHIATARVQESRRSQVKYEEVTSAQRYIQGIREWRTYNEANTGREDALIKLEDEFQGVKSEIDRIDQDIYAEIPSTIDMAFQSNYAQEIRFDNARLMKVDKQKKFIASSSELRSRMDNYLQSLVQVNSENLSGKVLKPEWLIEQEKHDERQKRQSLLTRARTLIQRGVVELEEDFFGEYKIYNLSRNPKALLHLSTSGIKEIQEQLARDKRQIELSQKSSVTVAPDIGLKDIHEFLNSLRNQLRVKKMGPYRRQQDERFAKWQEEIEDNPRTGKYQSKRQIPKDMYLYFVREREKILEKVFNAKELLENPPKTSNISSMWDVDVMRDYVDMISITTIPENITLPIIKQHHHEFSSVLERIIKNKQDLPVKWGDVITSMEGFIDPEQSPNDPENHLECAKEMENIIRRTSLPYPYSLFQDLLTIITNPLFPSEDLQAYPMDIILIWLQKRNALINAITNVDYQSKIPPRDFSDLKHTLYKKYLVEKNTNVQNELLKLRNNIVEQKFLNRMRLLNLVYEIPE